MLFGGPRAPRIVPWEELLISPVGAFTGPKNIVKYKVFGPGAPLGGGPRASLNANRAPGGLLEPSGAPSWPLRRGPRDPRMPPGRPSRPQEASPGVLGASRRPPRRISQGQKRIFLMFLRSGARMWQKLCINKLPKRGCQAQTRS